MSFHRNEIDSPIEISLSDDFGVSQTTPNGKIIMKPPKNAKKNSKKVKAWKRSNKKVPLDGIA